LTDFKIKDQIEFLKEVLRPKKYLSH